MDYAALRTYLETQQGDMLASLETLVNQESPSTDKDSLYALAAYLSDLWRGLGAETEVLEVADGAHHVRVTLPASTSGGASEPPALLIGHFDTVWSVGTLARRPFSVADGRAMGPGCFDMKGGLVIAEYALRAIATLNLPLPRPVVLLFNSDEETGSETSRLLIEAEAKKAAYALVLEPAIPGGLIKTARKGVGSFEIKVAGLASHAGAAPREGISAIEEMAHQILKLHAMTDYDAGTTVNVGVVEGGTRPNVVAAEARAEVDVRAWTREAAEKLERDICSLQPVDPRTTLSVTGGFDRFPMERTEGTVHMFETARRLGQAMGMDLKEGSTGGASDGNFTSALGVPTLDGLGVVGDGGHAEHEYVEVSSLPERAALLAALLCEL